MNRNMVLYTYTHLSWDVDTLEKIGYINVHWSDVTDMASYTEELKYANKDRLFSASVLTDLVQRKG